MKNFKILLDKPSVKPCMHFDEYSEALKDIIVNSDSHFAIGIFGEWGSGKTTLLDTIERKLLNDSQIITVRFSAWRYEKEEHLIIPLLDLIRESIIEWEKRTSKVKTISIKTAATIGKVITSLLAGFSIKIGVPQAIQFSLDANKAISKAEKFDKEEKEANTPKSFYHASFTALKEAFNIFIQKNKNRRIVIFIDDLDRCLPEGALDVLESMKLFFDLEGFVFVVGLDKEVIETAIDIKYSQNNANGNNSVIKGSDYIKKIFQVPFNLYPVSSEEVNDFINSIIEEEELPQSQVNELRQVVLPHLRHLFKDIGMNPREVKRYINAYILIRKIKPVLNKNVILVMLTVDFRADWALVQEGILIFKDAFIDALKRQINSDVISALESIDLRFREIPDDFLNYIRQEGREFLKERNIDKYIFAGEVTKSSHSNRDYTILINKIAKFRLEFKKVFSNETNFDRIESLRYKFEDISFSNYFSKRRTSQSAQRKIEEINSFLDSFSLINREPNKPLTVEASKIERYDLLFTEIIQSIVKYSYNA